MSQDAVWPPPEADVAALFHTLVTCAAHARHSHTETHAEQADATTTPSSAASAASAPASSVALRLPPRRAPAPMEASCALPIPRLSVDSGVGPMELDLDDANHKTAKAVISEAARTASDTVASASRSAAADAAATVTPPPCVASLACHPASLPSLKRPVEDSSAVPEARKKQALEQEQPSSGQGAALAKDTQGAAAAAAAAAGAKPHTAASSANASLVVSTVGAAAPTMDRLAQPLDQAGSSGTSQDQGASTPSTSLLLFDPSLNPDVLTSRLVLLERSPQLVSRLTVMMPAAGIQLHPWEVAFLLLRRPGCFVTPSLGAAGGPIQVPLAPKPAFLDPNAAAAWMKDAREQWGVQVGSLALTSAGGPRSIASSVLALNPLFRRLKWSCHAVLLPSGCGFLTYLHEPARAPLLSLVPTVMYPPAPGVRMGPMLRYPFAFVTGVDASRHTMTLIPVPSLQGTIRVRETLPMPTALRCNWAMDVHSPTLHPPMDERFVAHVQGQAQMRPNSVEDSGRGHDNAALALGAAYASVGSNARRSQPSGFLAVLLLAAQQSGSELRTIGAAWKTAVSALEQAETIVKGGVSGLGGGDVAAASAGSASGSASSSSSASSSCSPCVSVLVRWTCAIDAAYTAFLWLQSSLPSLGPIDFLECRDCSTTEAKCALLQAFTTEIKMLFDEHNIGHALHK